MLGELAKRVVNLVVSLLAAVTFFLVPIGGKTLWQHTVAIFSTREAAELERAALDTGRDVVDQARAPFASASARPPAGSASSAARRAGP
jgi:hypothetical protein